MSYPLIRLLIHRLGKVTLPSKLLGLIIFSNFERSCFELLKIRRIVFINKSSFAQFLPGEFIVLKSEAPERKYSVCGRGSNSSKCFLLRKVNIIPDFSSQKAMMPGRVPCLPGENPLHISWHDSAWIPILNQANVMDYFSERSNPFYDRTCNNEIIKMQRLSLDQLMNMTGIEYALIHVQEPILYVIRKQQRYSPQQTTPIADYYIIAGKVYQAPDLGSVLNSRIVSTVHHLQSAFEEANSYSRYHPSKGYFWELKVADKPSKKENVREEPSSLFQRQRVDMLLIELTNKYPLPALPPPQVPIKTENEIKTEPRDSIIIKQEKPDSPRMKPPPEKKPRIN